LQEAAAQRFDDFLSARAAESTDVGKMLANPTKGAAKYPESSLGVDGFEPSTT